MTEHLDVSGLEHSFGAQRVLDRVSFSVAEGERLCLLGPSGCGKTTTLQVIAGFIQAASGTVKVAGQPIDRLPPEKRNIGIMFQNYALFPHLSVFENVAFGLRMRRLQKAEIGERTMEALQLVRLAHAAEKSPKQLSGGEQQRIAFARAVAIRPSLLLLDEPFSNLDARLRIEMRNELLDLLRPLRIATLMVTHDQEEAMAIADRVAVMHAGRIEQIGTPQSVYDDPVSLFVARFLGESNVFDAEVAGGDLHGLQLHAAGLGPLVARANQAVSVGEDATVIVRPEHIAIAPATMPVAADAEWNRVACTVEEVVFLGHRTEWRVRAGPRVMMAWQSGHRPEALALGTPVIATWRRADTLVMRKDGPHAVH